MSRRWLRMAQTALSLYAQRCWHIIQYSLLGLSLWSLLPLWKRWFLLLLICGSCFLLLHHQSRRQAGVKGNRKEYPGVLRVSSSHRMDFNPSRLQMQFAVSPRADSGLLINVIFHQESQGQQQSPDTQQQHQHSQLSWTLRWCQKLKNFIPHHKKGGKKIWVWLQQSLGRNTSGIPNSSWLQLLGKSSSVYFL